MKKTCSGFTLIELLITITIITLLFSIGVAQYNKFNRRQILVKAKNQLISDLRLTQSKSLAAEKPTGCLTNLLEGHRLEFVNNQEYRIVAVCGSGPNYPEVKPIVSLPTNVTATIQPPGANNGVFFRVLSQGSPTDATITLSGFGETQTVTITMVGEIK